LNGQVPAYWFRTLSIGFDAFCLHDIHLLHVLLWAKPHVVEAPTTQPLMSYCLTALFFVQYFRQREQGLVGSRLPVFVCVCDAALNFHAQPGSTRMFIVYACA
jgi:hypothetical protein